MAKKKYKNGADVHILLEKDLLDAYDKMAETTFIKRNTLFNLALQDYLEKNIDEK